jgi:hypothetical protein
MNKCCWVKADGTYCHKPSKWKMADDGGEQGTTKVRKYDHLCPEHRKIDDASEDEEA